MIAPADLTILKPGETCWRVAEGARAAVLIDAAAYFGALRAALRKAERSVFIVGWDIDSRTRLVGPSGEADDGLPDQLGPFLTALVARRPALRVHLLLWDYSMLYALDREPLPSINLAWKTPEQIVVCLDDVLPAGASHHQKIVVIDDAIAFAGGIDLTTRRWDTPAHAVDHEARRDPAGEHYRPFHDMQMMVDGDAAAALGDLVRARWRSAACETPIEFKPVGNPWPEDVPADFAKARIGIARTIPEFDGKPEVREIEALYERAIATAEKSVYIENQYLTAGRVAHRLAARMQEIGALEAVIVGPNSHRSWLEERSMNAGRGRFMAVLRDSGVADRVRLLYPAYPGDPTGEGVMVHAKLMIVDDRLLRVGSSNLNNRSMGMDTECDLAIEAAGPDDCARIAEIRNRLIAEHLGTDADAVARAVAAHGSLIAAVESLSDGDRSLRPIDLSAVTDDEVARTVGQFADPERPIPTPDFVGNLFAGAPAEGRYRRWAKLLGAAAVLAGLIALWRLTPLGSLADPAEALRGLEALGRELWLPVAVPAVFVLAGLVAFPVTVLIAVTGMMFGPWNAFFYAIAGSLLSAAVTFGVGRAIGRGPLRSTIGPRVNRVSRALARKGVLSVIAVRMVPIAPFSMVNLVAGASRIGFADFLIGTFLGMAPGVLLIVFLGGRIAALFRQPTTGEVMLFGLALVAWLLLCLALQYLVTRLRARRD